MSRSNFSRNINSRRIACATNEMDFMLWTTQPTLSVNKEMKVFPQLSVADPGGGAGPPLLLIFETPDYILRSKLHLFTLK